MKIAKLELRQLTQFLSACQNTTISKSAQELGVAPSALSNTLRSLEEELRLPLFHREGGYLTPLPGAFWLFQQAVATLHKERRLHAVLQSSAHPPGCLRVNLDLSFSIGQFSKAASRASSATNATYPHTPIGFQFLTSSQPAPINDFLAADMEDGEQLTEIDIGYCPDNQRSDLVPFYEDQWYIVSLSGEARQDQAKDGDIFALDMHPVLIDSLIAYCRDNGIASRLKLTKGKPSDLSALLKKLPHSPFVMPRSMIADRLGLSKVILHPLDPPLVSRIGSRIRGARNPAAADFLEHLKQGIEGPEANARFDPAITARQIRYLNLVSRCGGISAAARVANIAQPSISSQIHKMETTLGVSLLSRQRDGAVLSDAGRRILPITTGIEQDLDYIVRVSREIAAQFGGVISIGTLPSSGHDSAITRKVAAALTIVRTAHPEFQIRVSEGTDAALHDRVKAGDLQLALVGTVQPQMARIYLGRSENLSVVAHPDVELGAESEITLARACLLPLVLGARQIGIHQDFVRAAARQNLKVQSVMEVGSLPLAIAMVREAPICTVLPASSVREDVLGGRLRVVPIAQEGISGGLSVIFSGERSRSNAERQVIQALVTAFGRPVG